MFDLDAYEEEVDFADDDVFQVVPTRSRMRHKEEGPGDVMNGTHLDLLYSNSMCRQSSIPTSILIELLLSGGMRKECTHKSFSLVTSAILREMVTLMKYLA